MSILWDFGLYSLLLLVFLYKYMGTKQRKNELSIFLRCRPSIEDDLIPALIESTRHSLFDVCRPSLCDGVDESKIVRSY